MTPNQQHVRAWLTKAERDLKVAQREVSDIDAGTDIVCFHCRQAVEKLFKAWLVWQEVEYPLTHDIEVLLDIIEDIDPHFEALREAGSPTTYAVAARYPGEYDWPSENDMKKALSDALEVHQYVMEALRREGVFG